MPNNRVPLRSWRYPEREILLNEIIPDGRPPFAPFPSVDIVVHGALCPVAVLHDLLHGIDYALTLQYFEEREQGLFQNFIAHIKSQLQIGDLILPEEDSILLENLRIEFLRYGAQFGFTPDSLAELWERYVSPWFNRKIEKDELNINGNDIYFQLYVSNPRTRFITDDGGNIHYPIRGWIDEVNLTRRQIILRTIKGNQDDTNPPLLSDYRTWLFQRILSTMNADMLPNGWQDVNFTDFDLIVETPYEDFIIENDEIEYHRITHQSLTWIHDIAVAQHNSVLREVFDNQQCIPEYPHEECAYPFRVCFKKNFTYPKSRAELRREIQPWLRFILWEKMWEGDKWHYQLLMLNQNELRDLGLIETTRVISYTDNELQLEVLGRDSSTFRGYERCTIVPFGTINCGLRIDGILSEVSGNVITFKMNDSISTISEEALLLVSPETISPMMRSEPPTFIKKNTQRELFYLQHFGMDDDNRAQTTSLIQLIETIFGDRELQRGPV